MWRPQLLMWRPQLRDPDGERVLEVAVNGQAAAIVTFNRRDFGVAPSRFGIGVLLPAGAIPRIRHEKHYEHYSLASAAVDQG